MTHLQKSAEISERNLPLTGRNGRVELELRDLLARDQRVRDAPPSLRPVADAARRVARWPRRRSTVASLSGTSYSTPIFMREAGTVHRLAARSTSSHVVPITSTDRAAVRIRNSSALATVLGFALSLSMKPGSSE